MLNNHPPYDITNCRRGNSLNTVKNTIAQNYHQSEKRLQSKTDHHDLNENSELPSDNRPTYGAYNTRNALPRGPYIQYKINNQQTQLDQKPPIYHSQQKHQLYHQNQSSDQDNNHTIELLQCEFASLPRTTIIQKPKSPECLQKKKSIFAWPNDSVNTLGRRVPLKSDNTKYMLTSTNNNTTSFDNLKTISLKNEYSKQESDRKHIIENNINAHYNQRHSSSPEVSSSFLKQIQTQNFEMVRDIKNLKKHTLATTNNKCIRCNLSLCVCSSEADVENREYFRKKSNTNTNYLTLREIFNRKDSVSLSQSEGWALLCQSVQALQDLFIADTPSPARILPLVNADSIRITSMGRVIYKLHTTVQLENWHVDSVKTSLSPEFLKNINNKISFTESDTEKMWIYSLGVTLRDIIPFSDDKTEQGDCITHSDNASNAICSISRQVAISKRERINDKGNGKNFDHENERATTKAPASMTRINNNYSINMDDGWRYIASAADTNTSMTSLNHTIISMCDPNINYRASLMNLLNVISEHCRGHHQIKPFSHIVMDLFKDAEIVTVNSINCKTPPDEPNDFKETKILSPVHSDHLEVTRHTVAINTINTMQILSNNPEYVKHRKEAILRKRNNHRRNTIAVNIIERTKDDEPDFITKYVKSSNTIGKVDRIFDIPNFNNRSMPELNAVKFATLPNLRVRRNRGRVVVSTDMCEDEKTKNFKSRGPEFIVNSYLLTEPIDITDLKCQQYRRTVSVLLLNGRNIRIICNPQSTTTQQIFETVVKYEGFKENFYLGLCALLGGDFVFLPSDLKIYKVAPQIWFSSYRKTNYSDNVIFTLFLRIKFFLPTLCGITSPESHHLHYLQLRKSILESQILCSDNDLISLGGLALQSELGDYEHTMQIMDYFTISHYLPEGVYQKNKDMESLLRNAHISKRGLNIHDAEKGFVTYVQKMTEYGRHLYSAVWTTEEQASQDVYLSISLSGIGLLQRSSRLHCDHQNSVCRTSNNQRNLLAHFDWLEIENLCFSKHVLCVVVRKPQSLKGKDNNRIKYKLRMDERKSYFAFTLAFEHHKFYMKLSHCYVSVKALSTDMNTPLSSNIRAKHDGTNEKSMNIEIIQADYDRLPLTAKNIKKLDKQNIKISAANRMRNITKSMLNDNKLLKIKNSILKRSKSSPGIRNDVLSIEINSVEEYQNKENELPGIEKLLGMRRVAENSVKQMSPNRIKMGTRAFSAHFLNKSYDNIYRSIDVMDFDDCEDNDKKTMSVTNRQLFNNDSSDDALIMRSSSESSLHSSEKHAYVITSSIASIEGETNYLSILQQDETVSNTLLENLHNLSGYNSTSDRIIAKVTIQKDSGDKMKFLSKNESGDSQYIKSKTESMTLGISIVQGTDNNVYVKDLVRHGPGELSGVQVGDQILAVNGVSLLTLPYRESLQILQKTGKIVELIVSQLQPAVRKQRLAKADLSVESSEQCQNRKQHQRNYLKSVDYLKHIRYETDDINQNESAETKFIQLEGDRNSGRSNILMATKSMPDLPKVIATLPKNFNKTRAMPRTMGLSRRYVGPVKYPVTPIRVSMGTEKHRLSLLVDEDDKQVFI